MAKATAITTKLRPLGDRVVIKPSEREEMFTGPTEPTPNLPALRKAAQYDASEGIVGWYIGYNGTGCTRLGHDASTVTVIIDHS